MQTHVCNAAQEFVEASGPLRDVQDLAGHRSLQTTQLSIAGSSDARRKVVMLI
jgi:integrase/recombinase XerD